MSGIWTMHYTPDSRPYMYNMRLRKSVWYYPGMNMANPLAGSAAGGIATSNSTPAVGHLAAPASLPSQQPAPVARPPAAPPAMSGKIQFKVAVPKPAK